MAPANSYGDERLLLYCAFCGGETGTRDHCPSKVLLDQPYPENLPAVPACRRCNASFSTDEEYVACLVSCILTGSTDPQAIVRPKIKAIMARSPALRARIENGHTAHDLGNSFLPEYERVNSVITKLAQGHALYELHEPCPHLPDDIRVIPFALMSNAERMEFESPPPATGWPEVGSRAMQRLIVEDGQANAPWVVVQEGMYRFHASADGGVSIRIVIQEYLAGHVRWD